MQPLNINNNITNNDTPRFLRTWRLTDNGLVEISKQLLSSDSGAIPIENMGAFLDKPLTGKVNENGEGQGIRYATASMQGWRMDMEDAHDIHIAISNEEPFNKWSFFAVFDGHAGASAATKSAEVLLKTILDTDQFISIAKLLKESNGTLTEEIKNLIKEGIRDGFLNHDDFLSNQSKRETSGTTAIAAIITPESIFFANLGDSRAILSNKSTEVFGTNDHKPYLEKEKERILKAGGNVMISRVNGTLAVSRAFGDFEYKRVPNLRAIEQLVSPEPDVYEIVRNQSDDEFFVIACDGIYDVFENAELADLVTDRLKVEEDLKVVCNQILDIALSKGSRDNMTIIIGCFDGAPKLDRTLAEKEAQWNEKVRKNLTSLISSHEAENGSETLCVENALKKINDLEEIISKAPFESPQLRTRYIVDNALHEYYITKNVDTV
uniref:PPM-type phosphatase domain-containing protein n=1 Tax=Rhabditophanes sp. KR3021 TaxID=114890 RepID=A0AC35UGE2_9BILA